MRGVWGLAVVGMIIGLAISGTYFPPPHQRIQVTPRINFLAVNGEVVSWSDEDLFAVLDFFRTKKTPAPLMFDHGSTVGGAAAGWLYGCALDTNGISCEVSWTRYGQSEACSGAWRFISPNVRVHKDEDGVFHPYGLIEASLTNIPAIDGMAPVAPPPCPVPFFSTMRIWQPGVRGLE